MGILTLFIAVVTLLVASFSLAVGYFCFRYQYVSLILNQSLAKANECNSQLIETNYYIKFNYITQITTIISSTIEAVQLLDYHYQENKFLEKVYSREKCLDQFYLLLHTTIKLFYKNRALSIQKIEEMQWDSESKATLKKQFETCCDIFDKTVKKFHPENIN